ncbi:MAG: hypothetical protein P794_07330 [Epsilonproteobacteria bacterium (ex Lamellibrachia satsuma)]|nr:MAG: hypothetical protein P794_07330 [Epsilonproteobacteria bacterium (ex Lamellibrachia satsuma)]
MGIRVVLAVLFTVVLGGCVSTPDAEGWRSSQKSEFLDILKEDRYASICDQGALYEKVRESRDSRLMSKLLIAYTRNLANGCIDLKSFEASQDAKKEREINTYYATYLQSVKASDVMRKLKAGETITQILAPYVPEGKQFEKLIDSYHRLKAENTVSPTLLHKVRLNIERIKLMQPKFGENYVCVNVPEFEVRVVEKGQTALKFPVIVGKPRWQTPIFSSSLQYATINPQWGVPDKIARKEVIPKLLKNPDYLRRKNMVVRRSYNIDSEEVDPTSVDWEQYLAGRDEIPYKIIEKPSKRNALGRVKFIFPNMHSVYMHDTQAKNLFKRKIRCFSHGCIRLQQPINMLDYITTNYTAQDIQTVKTKYKSLKTFHLGLNKPLPVHIEYLTTYVNESGKLLVLKDIYGFDRSQKLNF